MTNKQLLELAKKATEKVDELGYDPVWRDVTDIIYQSLLSVRNEEQRELAKSLSKWAGKLDREDNIRYGLLAASAYIRALKEQSLVAE